MSRRKGASSERIARYILEQIFNFEIVETSKEILLNGLQISEADMIAEDPDGQLYLVEVKAGYADVGSLQQVYANSQLISSSEVKYKPMVICKGFSNEAAKKMAEELNIKAIRLSDMFMILGPEELEVIVREAVKEIFDAYGLRPILLDEMTEIEQKLLEAIVNASSFEDVIKNINMPETLIGKMLGQLRKKGVLPIGSGNFETLKRRANRILVFFKKEEKYKELEKNLSEIMELLQDIKSRLGD
jgi:predicted RecB family endonuclease